MHLEPLHVLIVLVPFLALPLARWAGRRVRHAYRLAIVPAALTGYFAWMMTRVTAGGAYTATLPWASNLGLSLSFYFDGLGLLFAMLITGIGTLIVLYAVGYLGSHPLAGRFQVTLFAFMGSMLGVVLSDNILTLFVFWELTGFTSYFLIAFDHERQAARRAALQALLVTSTGGLALLAAGVMMWHAGGTPSLSALREAGAGFTSHPMYATLAVLVMAAAFTKSAQFPFHFWLPNAMEAPTPVSAYLHSATMVKAGVYLVARMTPLLGGTTLWITAITAAGAITLAGGAYRSLLETDLKRILAYTTVAALGAMMLLLGIGTGPAIVAGLVYLVAHAFYKGAMFLVAGAIDHETGTRDVRALSGLGVVMPVTAVAGILAAASMAGLPPLLGFLAKEQLYAGIAEKLPIGFAALLLLALAVVASAMMGASALTAGVKPFMGKRTGATDVHEPAPSLWIGPVVLAGIGLFAGLAPGLVERPVTLAATSITGQRHVIDLGLWHGITPTLVLSGVTIVLTLLLYWQRRTVRERLWPRGLNAERLYNATLAGVDRFSGWIGPLLQSGSLRSYVRVIILTVIALLAAAYTRSGGLPHLGWRTPPRVHEVGLALVIILAAISAARARSIMAAVLSLGTVGYSLALLYVLYGAPDLAATQFAVETLTVVLFVLVFYQLRGFYYRSSLRARVRDATMAGATGAIIALLVLVTSASGITSRLSNWFIDAAPTEGHGRNVVNVILVDFRAFDTMGEITVLVTVAIGVRALLRIGRERQP